MVDTMSCPGSTDALKGVIIDDNSQRLDDLRVEQNSIYQSLLFSRKINQQDLQVAWNRTDKQALHAAVLQLRDGVHREISVKNQSDRRGIGRVNSKLSGFATSIAKVFDDYSGISDIVRGIDSNFGPIAYGTFSVFLVVAQSKEVHRAMTQHILEELDKWLARIKIIRTEDVRNFRLKKYVLDVYIETVDFFQYMTKYLCSTRTSRAWRLISRPPKRDLKERLDRIREKSTDLMDELYFRLHEQMDETAYQLDKISYERQEHAEISKRNVEDNHRTQLRRVAKALKLPFEYDELVAKMSAHCNSETYQDPFKFQRKAAFRPTPLQQISLEVLQQRPAYQEWMRALSSSILLLGGENRDISISRCWLSPVATKVFHSMKQSSKSIAVFHSFSYARMRFRCSSHEHEILLAFKSILYQILSAEYRLCDSFAEDLVRDCSCIEALPTDDEQIEKQIRAYAAILSEVCFSKCLEPRTVFIILDGVEQLPYPAPVTLLENILKLLDVRNEQITIKVLAICSTLGLRDVKGVRDKDRLRYALELGADKEIMRRIFADLSWNQPVLTRKL